VMDRVGVQVLVNLGHEAKSFEVPKGFQVVLASRDGIRANGGEVTLPVNALAILSLGNVS
jgi:hypothetical protein